MSNIKLSTLSSPIVMAEPTISYFHGILVDNAQDCPSLTCSVNHPHLHQNSTPIPPHRSDLPIVYIRRFEPEANPYPRTNIWEIMGGVPNQLDQPVYIDGYGELILSKVPIPIEDEDWQVLVGCTMVGTPVVILAWKKEKTEERKNLGIMSLFTHLFSFFTCDI